MDTQGQEHASWGFKNPEPGWYLMEFVDGIVEETPEGTDRLTLRIPLAVKDGDFAGSQQSIFITLNATEDKGINFAKKKAADILTNAGLYQEFNDKFPGDISPIDPRVLKKIKTKLPGKLVMVKLDNVTRKSKKSGEKETYLNIMELHPATFKPEVIKGASKAKVAPASTEVASDGSEDW